MHRVNLDHMLGMILRPNVLRTVGIILFASFLPSAFAGCKGDSDCPDGNKCVTISCKLHESNSDKHCKFYWKYNTGNPLGGGVKDKSSKLSYNKEYNECAKSGDKIKARYDDGGGVHGPKLDCGKVSGGHKYRLKITDDGKKVCDRTS